MKTGNVALLALIALSALVLPGCRSTDDALITIDPSRTYQTMKGWEVSARLWEQDKQQDRYDRSWLAHRDEIFDRLVNELGIDRVRIEIRSGAENPIDYWSAFEKGEIGYNAAKHRRYETINDNDDPDVANAAGFQLAETDWQVEQIVLPLKRRIEANGEKLYLNLVYVDFGTETGNKGSLSHARRPDEYAELIHVTFEHLKSKYGLVPDALEVALEPDNTDEWDGPAVGAAMVAAAARLGKAGFSPAIIAPSTTYSYRAAQYFDHIAGVPGAAAVLSTLSYHRYDPIGATDGTLSAISERARKFGLETAMLEHLTGDVLELHGDLTQANVSSWQQYGIAYIDSPERDRAGGYYYLVDRASGRVRMASRTRALAQYFRFVRSGAVRIDAVSDSASRQAVAFRNRNGLHAVIVQATSGATIHIEGAPAGAYGVRYTTATETGRELDTIRIGVGQRLSARLPGAGVITFYQSVGH
jgi:O-glycosyl hydrolase